MDVSGMRRRWHRGILWMLLKPSMAPRARQLMGCYAATTYRAVGIDSCGPPQPQILATRGRLPCLTSRILHAAATKIFPLKTAEE